MAPIRTASGRSAVRPRSRSRSAEGVVRGSVAAVASAVSGLPQLKDWVLIRVNTRFWSKAVPALVSKVLASPKSEDCSICLVLPNRLSLQFGFGSKKPFMELSDVPLREIRPYFGTDHFQLHATLLQAIRKYRMPSRPALGGQAAAAAASAKGGEAATEEQLQPVESPMPAQLPFVQAQETQPQEGMGVEAEGAPGHEGDDEHEEHEPGWRKEQLQPLESPMPAQLPFVQAQETQLRHMKEQEQHEQLSSPMPATPHRASVPRELARQESAPKVAQFTCAARSATVVEGKVPVKQPVTAEMVPVRDLAVCWHEFTKAVARAFKAARAQELSRMELVKAVGDTFDEKQIQDGLARLDREEKVFLTGDLVFLI